MPDMETFLTDALAIAVLSDLAVLCDATVLLNARIADLSGY